jgi:hypothetical protein
MMMVDASSQGVELDGQVWVPCSDRAWGCNWLLSADAGAAGASPAA